MNRNFMNDCNVQCYPVMQMDQAHYIKIYRIEVSIVHLYIVYKSYVLHWSARGIRMEFEWKIHAQSHGKFVYFKCAITKSNKNKKT